MTEARICLNVYKRASSGFQSPATVDLRAINGNCFFIQYLLQCPLSVQPLLLNYSTQGGRMNQQQSEFAERAMQQLRQVIEQCVENSATAGAILGRRRVGRHIVVVRIIAELDEGFSAPLASHASRPGSGSTVKPDYSMKTEHRTRNNQTNRWHKPIFD